MVGGAAPHGRSQVTQEGHVGRAGERGKTWASMRRGLKVYSRVGEGRGEGIRKPAEEVDKVEVAPVG